MITHDGGFEGFFTALFLAAQQGEDFSAEEEGLFMGERATPTPLHGEHLLNEIRTLYGHDTLTDFMSLYFSEKPQREKTALHYLNLLKKHGKPIRNALQNPVIHAVTKIRHAYFFEVHRFHGLVRFREIDDTWLYAPIEPDHHILPYLWQHFRRRLPSQNWILHDVKRETAVMYNEDIYWHEGFTLTTHEQDLYTEKEKHIQNLWRRFYESVAIPQRKNPRQQRQMMPKKYWKYLIEKSS